MRRQIFITVRSTVAGQPVERLSFVEQYDGKLTVATAGFAPLVVDLTVDQATAAYDVLVAADVSEQAA